MLWEPTGKSLGWFLHDICPGMRNEKTNPSKFMQGRLYIYYIQLLYIIYIYIYIRHTYIYKHIYIYNRHFSQPFLLRDLADLKGVLPGKPNIGPFFFLISRHLHLRTLISLCLNPQVERKVRPFHRDSTGLRAFLPDNPPHNSRFRFLKVKGPFYNSPFCKGPWSSCLSGEGPRVTEMQGEKLF